MIKLIISDFDGTLVSSVEAHYLALNRALEEVAGKEFVISEDEHKSTYNGLSTKTKLKMLVADKNLDKNLTDLINKKKQEYTSLFLESSIKEDKRLRFELEKLKKDGYKLHCASNAIYKTIEVGLKKLGIFDLFDFVIGNENIKRQKPNPDIFIECFLHAGVDPKEALIIEDSKHGREAAYRSMANVCTVNDPLDFSYEYIKSHPSFFSTKKVPWVDSKLNILILAAGLGSRFSNVGYEMPKPLIDFHDKTMIEHVINNLNIDANYIFAIQEDHCKKFNLDKILKAIKPGCKIIKVNGLTEGAACTALLAKEIINNDYPLIIANCDQIVDWDSCEFVSKLIFNNVDGEILTFKINNPDKRWSYVKLDDNGYVTDVQEKNPISNHPTVGIYGFRFGKDFVKYAESMINKKIKVNNEYYLAPVYNEMILDNKKIINFDCNEMWGIGDPSSLNKYLELFPSYHGGV
ncbi:MAG: HAD-IA family hydrolase [Chitinophagales bacterium]|nr:HAD-IA family hydrolase [Chitinophagales bacterium]